jgi:MarR family transcriptional regulator, lower aerobic nicotinate degradation pathway regulator
MRPGDMKPKSRRTPDSHRSGMRLRRAPGAASRYRLEEQVGHLLRRAHQRHTALFAKHIVPAAFRALARGTGGSVTPTQWAALVTLRELGTASQNQLGRLTAIDAATMQGLIQRLIQRGMVAQRKDAGDRRRNLLRLTREGLALVDACLPHAQRITRLTLAPLSPEERQALLRLLRRLT